MSLFGDPRHTGTAPGPLETIPSKAQTPTTLRLTWLYVYIYNMIHIYMYICIYLYASMLFNGCPCITGPIILLGVYIKGP